jgi:HAD superfamily hydrolase (TIGR01509 family)
MNYEAILFDMDGVIIDTHQSVTQFWQDYARRYQVRLTHADWEQHIYGCPATHTMDVLFPQLSAEERQSILTHMADYETHLTYTPVKGVVSFLQTLRQHNLPTALVTSGQTWKVKAVTNQLGIRALFMAYVTIEDISKGKPDPACYVRAARLLQKGPEQCLVFEDSISGVQAAVAAGALCIGVQASGTGDALRQAGARYVVPDFHPVKLHGESESLNRLELRIEEAYCLPLAAPSG